MAISIEAAGRDRKRVIWGAPTRDQVRVIWEETRHGVRDAARFMESRMQAVFPSGGRITFRSLDDPDNVRGHTADLVVIDECGDVKERAWQGVLRPMLLDTGGGVWAIGTPRGRNWFWQEWLDAPTKADSVRWQAPTLGCAITAEGLVRRPHPLENPDIQWDEIMQVWHQLPEQMFRTEILAEFVLDSGAVFRNVTACINNERHHQPEAGHTYAFGIDWGRHRDFTVVSVMDCTTRDQVWLDRFSQVDFELQYERIKVLADRYKPSLVLVESNSIGQPGLEALARRGLRVHGWMSTNATKAKLVEDLALAFDKGAEEIGILDEAVQTAELLAFEAKRLPSGVMTYGGPDSGHDDTVIALALSWQLAKSSTPASRGRSFDFAIVP